MIDRRALLCAAWMLPTASAFAQMSGGQMLGGAQSGNLALGGTRRLRTTPVEVAGFGGLPPDASWTQLSERQQQQLRELHAAHLPPGGDPPYPAVGFGFLVSRLGTLEIPPAGALSLKIHLGRSGSVRSVDIDGAAAGDAEIRRQIERIVEMSSFRAARCDGKPCLGTFELRLRYPD